MPDAARLIDLHQSMLRRPTKAWSQRKKTADALGKNVPNSP
jgi:hypothetical protein